MAGASSRYRLYQYFPILEREGCEITALPLLGDVYLERFYSGKRIPVQEVIRGYVRRVWSLLTCRRFDLIWLQQEALPWIPDVLEAILVQAKAPLVADYDDAHFHKYEYHRFFLCRKLLGNKIDRVMSRASLVIAGNKYLADRAFASGASRVEIIPTVVDLARYQVTSPPRNNVFTIGWIGSPTTAHYLTSVDHALREVCSDGSARVVVVGSSTLRVDGVPVEIRPWSEQTEVQDLGGFDVGIMPLPDTPWERGKCGFKLIQYMAAARPAVASPVGVNSEIICHGTEGFLAATTRDWIQAFQRLKQDRNLREQMGRSGRAKVEQKYDLRVTAPKILELFRAVAGM